MIEENLRNKYNKLGAKLQRMSRIFQKKVKALAESKNAMKEELLILQMDLKNMIEEESQLLEGTSNKFKVVE